MLYAETVDEVEQEHGEVATSESTISASQSTDENVIVHSSCASVSSQRYDPELRNGSCCQKIEAGEESESHQPLSDSIDPSHSSISLPKSLGCGACS